MMGCGCAGESFLPIPLCGSLRDCSTPFLRSSLVGSSGVDLRLEHLDVAHVRRRRQNAALARSGSSLRWPRPAGSPSPSRSDERSPCRADAGAAEPLASEATGTPCGHRGGVFFREQHSGCEILLTLGAERCFWLG